MGNTRDSFRDMSGELAQRHGRDSWMDVLFVAAAVLLIAVSIGSLTSKAAGTNESRWTVTVIESNFEIVR